MTDNPHFVKAFSQKPDAGEGVVLEILRCAVDDVSGRLPKATVIVAERGNPGTGQGVGNNGKRLVLKDFLVPVLQAASRDHNENGRFFCVAGRKDQCALQDSISVSE